MSASRSTFRALVLSAVACAGLAAGLATAAAAATRVGFAVRDITPPGSLSGICLGGYGSLTCREATGVHDRLYARAMAISADATASTPAKTVALVSLDLVGASNRAVKAIVSGVNAGGAVIDAANVVVAETHSHASPDLVGLWGRVPDAYKRHVIDQAAAALRAAITGAAPAQLWVGSGTFGETDNRRGWAGADRDLVVLDARTPAGARIGTLVTYAAHPTILPEANRLISRDWVGALVDRAEASLGADKVMFINGSQGDVLPRTATTGGSDDFDRAARYGGAVADAALALLPGARPVGEGLVYSRRSFSQCVTNQNLLLARAIGYLDYDLQTSWQCGLTGLVVQQLLTSQVAYLRLGREVQVAIVPGEAVTRMSIDGVGAPGFPSSSGSIKASMKAPVRVVFGMATDFLGYFINADEWNEPAAGKNPANVSYEEGVSLGSPADGWIRDRVKSLVTADNPRL